MIRYDLLYNPFNYITITLYNILYRQMMKRQRFLHKHMRLQWAATTIQRIVRGCNARRRVASVIQATYDTEIRMLARKKAAWQHW